MTRSIERLALAGSLCVLGVIGLTGAREASRSLAEARIEALTLRLDALERRMAAGGLTVKAPFTVTDAGGKSIMTVTSTPRGMAITDAGKKVVIGANAQEEGGVFWVSTDDGQHLGLLTAVNGSATLQLRDGPVANRIALTVPKTGSAEIAVLNEGHSQVVSIEHWPKGGGKMNLMDDSANVLVTASVLPSGGFVKTLSKDGSRVALMGIDGKSALLSLRDGKQTPRLQLAVTEDGSPALVLLNSKHINALTMKHGPRGDGLLQISRAAGMPMLEAGVLASMIGILRVGPRFLCSGELGLAAPDCIKGHP